MAKNIFDEFTRKYQLPKTLRFELVPTEKTKELLKENNVFEKDEKIERAYQEIKPLFDALHREFVAEALDSKKVDIAILKEFAGTYNDIASSGKKDPKKLSETKKKIYKHIATLLNELGNDWKEKYGKVEGKKANVFKASGFKILTDAHIMRLLEERHPDKTDLLKNFKGFFTYFSGFNQSRENFYKDDGTSTAVATRIADNLVPFLENISEFKKYYIPNKEEIGLKNKESAQFKIDAYAGVLLQHDIDDYNATIGELNRRMKVLRDSRQNVPDFKKSNYPLLRTLKNQILGEREKKQLFEQIEDEQDAQKRFAEVVDEAERRFGMLKNLIVRLGDGSLAVEDERGIYFNNRAINTISRRFLNDAYSFEKELPQRSGKTNPEGAKVTYFVSLVDVREALEKQDLEFVFKDEGTTGRISKEQRLYRLLELIVQEFQDLFSSREQGAGTALEFDKAHKDAKQMLAGANKNIRDKENRKIVKAYFDAGMPIFQMGKYFSLEIGKKKAAEKPVHTNADFYNPYEEYSKEFNFAKHFDLFRNYISKKPGDDEHKVKLNFESSVLLSGFDKNKEPEKLGVILRKDGEFYLGIIHKKSKKIFDEKENPQIFDVSDSEAYEKMEYKLFPDPKRMIPKVAFAEGNRSMLDCTPEILVLREEFKKFQDEKKESSDSWSKKFDKSKLKGLIEYYQHALTRLGYTETFGFSFKDPSEYATLGEFNDDVARQQYKVKFRKVSGKYIDQCLNDGKLFLFSIKNKDLGSGTRGLKNLHTLYFLNLFYEQNLDNPTIKLSGGAEVFLRRGKAHELESRKDSKGKEVLAHKRFAEDKIFLHVPILLNAQSSGAPTSGRFNREVRVFLYKHPEVSIIGIDRGEKHLLYYSVINAKGEILEQGSMNELEVAGKDVDFHNKLVSLEKERIKNRRSWEPVRAIKDIKKGYVSHAIYKIVQLIDKYQAIVVLEDLNMRFKQVRGGVERSVYQQFEKALIDKLGYLVFKGRDFDAPGGAMRGYQLAAPFESFEKLGKQTGFVFYTQADYTSVTDPLTGFRKNIYISNSASQEKIKNAFQKFKAIGWDDKEQSYFFRYDPNDFIENKRNKRNDEKIPIPKDGCAVYAKVPRIRREKGKDGYWTYESVDVNEKFKELFRIWQFENPEAEDMQDEIARKEAEGALRGKKAFDDKEKNFYESFIYLFNLILNLRNSFSLQIKLAKDGEVESIDEGIDFIASPVKPFFATAAVKDGEVLSEGKFADFEKRIIGEEKKRILKEFNGDANGAYNIARKGILILDAIRREPEKPELYISKSNWDAFVQSQWNPSSKSRK